MSGGTDLKFLISCLEPQLDCETYLFIQAPSFEASGCTPLLAFAEEEGVTFILRVADAERLQVSGHYRCRRITLNVHSALEAVGLLATVSTALARAGISVNCVSAFHHDHLFVPEDQAEDAMAVLSRLSEDARRGSVAQSSS